MKRQGSSSSSASYVTVNSKSNKSTSPSADKEGVRNKQANSPRISPLSAAVASISPMSPNIEVENTQWLARLLKQHALLTVNVHPTKAIKKNITHVLKYLPKTNVRDLQLSLNEQNQKVSEIHELKCYFIDHVKLKKESPAVYLDFLTFIKAFHPNCFVYDEEGKAKDEDGVDAEYLQTSLEQTHISCVTIAKNGTLHTPKGTKPFVGHFICGLMTMRYIPFDAFKKHFKSQFNYFDNNKWFMDKDTPPLEANAWTVYVDVVCSAFGLGGQLVKLLETPKVRKKLTMHYKTKLTKTKEAPQYAFISLTSIPNAYSFYSSQMGFERSLDTERTYPILYISSIKWNEYEALLQTQDINIEDIFPVREKIGLLIRGYLIYKVTPLFSKLFNALTNKNDKNNLMMPADKNEDELYLYTKRISYA